MPIYTLICDCGRQSEHLIGAMDPEKKAPCPACGKMLSVAADRNWRADIPEIQCESTGCSYNYFDEGLDCHIKNKQHRQDEMKRQGLQEYSPDPELKKHRDEARYIKKQSLRSDPEARVAVNKQYKQAHKRRQRKAIDRVFDSVPDAV